MTKKKNGNKMWIAGAVLGAVAGAAYALWKTPMSGQELRGKLASGPVAQRDDVTTDQTHTPGTADKILSKVEQTLAPLVGVELGKTANGTAPSNGAVTDPIEPVKATPPAQPKTPEAPFKAAKVDQETVAEEVAATSDTAAYGTDTIRAQRFAWGSPTPEAGVQPVPVDPVAEQVVPEPEAKPAKEPVAAAASTNSTYGSEKIGSNRFAWGEPAPNANGEKSATAAPQQRTGGVNATNETSRPVEGVSDEATAPGSKQRKFPSLGGLE